MPKIAVIVRKAYGGGHIAMGGRPVNPDLLVAWPSAEMGFMAPDAGIRTVFRRRLEALEAEQGVEARNALAAELEAEWAAESQPWEAAANIILDDVIDPRETRAGDRRGNRLRVGHAPARQRPGEGLMATVDAHITGTVWTVDVAVGDVIEEGDVVAVLESMKMEMPVESEVDGTVAEVLCATGDAVTEGQALVRLV